MSLNTAKKTINRNNLMSLADKRTLKTAFSELNEPVITNASDITTNTSNISSLTTEVQLGTSAAVIATVGGETTGLIPDTAHYAQVTSSVGTKQISLPAAVDGKKLDIMCFTMGCELISAVVSDKVNDVDVGATNEAALIANTLYSLTYTSDDGNWVMTGLTKEGAVETPVIPDAL